MFEISYCIQHARDQVSFLKMFFDMFKKIYVYKLRISKRFFFMQFRHSKKNNFLEIIW